MVSFFKSIVEAIVGFCNGMYQAVANGNNASLYVEGLKNTLLLTLMALVLGIVLGVIVAIIKYFHKTTHKLKMLNAICEIYTTVIRGTPVMVQLLMTYFVIFAAAPKEYRLYIAALCFGINSGAYVSEIIRGGLMAIDVGQTEAGRSLGLSSVQTMRLIILPQALQNIVPALFNELISLLKETSVAQVISLHELTFAGDTLRASSYSPYPLLVSALIYLILVLIFTGIQKAVEKLVRKSDRVA